MKSPRNLRPARFGPRIVAALFLLAIAVVLPQVGAGAASSITEPSANPSPVTFDAAGKPLPVTVVATGFPAGHQVFVEQCNGRAPTSPKWSVSLDCDNGSAPAPAIVGADGTVRFPATDHNHAFVPFVGPSPSLLFNCLRPGDPLPNNGLNSYTTCQIRVSSNNTQATEDQVFHPIVFGTGTGSGSSSSSVPIAVAVGLVLVAVVGGVVWARRRRSTARPSA